MTIEYLERIEIFVETGMSDLDKLQSAVGEGNTERLLLSPTRLKVLRLILD